MTKNFFVISCYGENDNDWIQQIPFSQYHLYVKNQNIPSSIDKNNLTYIKNVGYNIFPYMHYIVNNYDNLPEVVVFCKNNVIGRHVSSETFKRLSQRKVFTPIEEPGRWTFSYPVSLLSSDNGFLEINNSWYTPFHPLKYFSDFDQFWKFIFKTKTVPFYLRFAPGANYVVPKENILLRSKEFYTNLMNFVSHDQLSGESHMVERALHAIWTTTLEESEDMQKVLNVTDLDILALNHKPSLSKFQKRKNYLFLAIAKSVHKLLYTAH